MASLETLTRESGEDTLHIPATLFEDKLEICGLSEVDAVGYGKHGDFVEVAG
jgi:hypothetical protein